jgi:hypothetical protein
MRSDSIWFCPNWKGRKFWDLDRGHSPHHCTLCPYGPSIMNIPFFIPKKKYSVRPNEIGCH